MNLIFRILIGALLIGSAMHAPIASAFNLSPAIIEIALDPGSNQTVYVRVENDETVRKSYIFTVQKFIPKGDRGQQEFLPPEETSGLPEWMYFDRPAFSLEPGESLNIPVILRIPTDASAGGHYAALFFSEQPEGLAPGQALATVARTGALFLVTVNGDASPEFTVDEFRAESERYAHLPVGFRAKVTNRGGTHAAAEGEVRIRNMFGSTVAKLDLNNEAGRVLPGSSRVYTPVWGSGNLREGKGFVTRLMNELSNFAIGRYEARLALSGPGSEGAESPAAVFYVWPTTLLMVMGIGALLLVVFLLAFKKLVIRLATRG